MAVAAEDLLKDCDLVGYADSVSIVSGCMGLSMLFGDVSMGDKVRAPGDVSASPWGLVRMVIRSPPPL